MHYYFISILTLLAGGILSLLVKEKYKLQICTISSFAALCTATFQIKHVLAKEVTFSEIINNPLLGSIDFVLDPLTAIFAFAILLLGFLGIFYANGYLKPYLNKNKKLSL